MSFLPLNLIFAYPPIVQLLYFIFSFLIGVAGWNRKMGFWGYFFSSVLFSPVIGLLLVAVSGPKRQPPRAPRKRNV